MLPTVAMTMAALLPFLFMMLIYIGIAVFIQSKLSKSENKYLGLILPVLSLLISVVVISAFWMFATEPSTYQSEVNGVIRTIDQTEDVDYIYMLALFGVMNIPTVILGGIYYTERKTRNLRIAIEKIKIEDL